MEYLKVIRKFNFGVRRSVRNNDFFSDRIVHRHTINILIVFIVLSTFRRLFNNPINCWVPAELRRYERYMNRYCWLTGTYYVDQTYDLNQLHIEARNETLLKYYQWIHFFLIFQAFLFYLPRLFWSYITEKILDYDLINMIDAAIKYDTYSFDLNRIIKYLSSNLIHTRSYLPIKRLQQTIKIKKKIEDIEKLHDDSESSTSSTNHLPEPKLTYDVSKFVLYKHRFSKFLLTFTYIFTKVFYLLIAIVQILTMNSFLSSRKHHFYGYEVFKTILNGDAELSSHNDSKIFPRITVCDVTTRELGTHHSYSIQCVLSFNLFNERIYAFLWFWIMLVVIPFLTFDLLTWFFRIFIQGTSYRYKFIKHRVRIYNKTLTKKEKYFMKLFTEYYIGSDGIFILRLLEHNSNASVVAELINQMWNQFRIEQKK